MRRMVTFILGSRSGDKVIESLHLNSHAFHLRIHNADSLFVNRPCGLLNGGIVFVDGLLKSALARGELARESTYCPIHFHLAFQAFP